MSEKNKDDLDWDQTKRDVKALNGKAKEALIEIKKLNGEAEKVIEKSKKLLFP
tara:strand:+ start:23129 stop:23287 length:159 start_codon:yes stop_codon:yes gene_type:complete